MKKLFFVLLKSTAALSLLLTTVNVNSTCIFTSYQPALPEQAKTLRKF